MKISVIDFAIVGFYALLTVFIAFQYRRKASQTKEDYLLGGKSLPWYLLSLSDASDMFDISGTIWMVGLCFTYGLKSIWMPWLWPVFNQVFLMVYLSRWLRRSNVTTGAEWLEFRFGRTGKGVQHSKLIIIVFALLSCIGFLAYGFIGLGKLMVVLLPWDQVKTYVPIDFDLQYVPVFYGAIFALLAVFYSVLGGMHSIVINDVVKFIIMSAACIWVAIIARMHLHASKLVVPEGWYNPFFGGHLRLNWDPILHGVNRKIQTDGYSLFGLFFAMMTFKGVLASLAGPAPSYDMQKILSTRSPEEASKMSGFVSVILLPVRYALIIGLTVLALLYTHQMNLNDATGTIDFDRILPAVINNILPIGLVGLLLTGLLGAFMSNFSGTLNAAQAYIVNDVYLKYLAPRASTQKMISINYCVGITIAIVSIVIGVFVRDISQVLNWLVSGLYGGYIAANVLKWHWWRFNATGFFCGMLSGIVSGLIMSKLIEDTQLLYYFPVLLGISLAGSIAGCYFAPPVEQNTLKHFYLSVRPWGFWGPTKASVLANDPSFVPNRNFKRNMINILLGILGQLCLTVCPLYLVLNQRLPLMIAFALLCFVIFKLKKNWWDRLADD